MDFRNPILALWQTKTSWLPFQAKSLMIHNQNMLLHLSQTDCDYVVFGFQSSCTTSSWPHPLRLMFVYVSAWLGCVYCAQLVPAVAEALGLSKAVRMCPGWFGESTVDRLVVQAVSSVFLYSPNDRLCL